MKEKKLNFLNCQCY